MSKYPEIDAVLAGESEGVIITGDVLDAATWASIPEGSVQCVVTSPPYFNLRSYLPADHPDKASEIGGEATPEEYVARMVEVFRHVRRVLHDSGVCFVNIGDSYASGKGNKTTLAASGLKPKDLMGIPWMVAFALRKDGWYLRSAIIWAKGCSGVYQGGSVMPESVLDRPTKSYETVFLLAKNSRYFCDMQAVKEQSAGVSGGACFGKQSQDAKGTGAQQRTYDRPEYSTHNLRDVLVVQTQNFGGAHFAVMPPKLAEYCIRMGSSEKGCCPSCHAPWERTTSVEHPPLRTTKSAGPHGGHGLLGGNRFDEPIRTTTTGWKPTCTCNAGDPVPCVVLDPFMGSGTTGMVAAQLGRSYLGIELNESYVKMAEERIANTVAVKSEDVNGKDETKDA